MEAFFWQDLRGGDLFWIKRKWRLERLLGQQREKIILKMESVPHIVPNILNLRLHEYLALSKWL